MTSFFELNSDVIAEVAAHLSPKELGSFLLVLFVRNFIFVLTSCDCRPATLSMICSKMTLFGRFLLDGT